MTDTMEYGPDNPRDWDPNHRTLKSPYAPHETGAVLRCVQAGNVGQKLFNIFKRTMTAEGLMKSLNKDQDGETQARDQQREICNGAKTFEP